jgi:hypothetical protein
MTTKKTPETSEDDAETLIRGEIEQGAQKLLILYCASPAASRYTLAETLAVEAAQCGDAQRAATYVLIASHVLAAQMVDERPNISRHKRENKADVGRLLHLVQTSSRQAKGIKPCR